MRHPVLKILLVLASIVVVALIAVYLICQIPPSDAPPPLPAANAYPALLQTAGAITAPSSEITNLNHQQLQAPVDSNAPALRMVRSNLDEEIQVPVEYSQAYAWQHALDLNGFLRIARAFLAESRLAQMEKRPADAANSCLDAIRLGVVCARGGVITDSMVGDSIESMGTAALGKLGGNLDQKTCKDIAQKLEDIDQQKQPWEQILKQDHYWSYRTFPGVQRLSRLILFRSVRAMEAKTGQRFKTQQTNTRRLTISLAARAYYLENGHAPATTADLTPDYLTTIPLAPVTGAKMTYLPTF